MPAWPASLPELGLSSSDQKESSTIRTSMEVGPSKLRRRVTKPRARIVDALSEFTGAQRTIFDSFYDTTLVYGSLAFDYEDPHSDGTVSVRFIGTPRFRLRTPGDPDDRLWQVAYRLEVIL